MWLFIRLKFMLPLLCKMKFYFYPNHSVKCKIVSNLVRFWELTSIAFDLFLNTEWDLWKPPLPLWLILDWGLRRFMLGKELGSLILRLLLPLGNAQEGRPLSRRLWPLNIFDTLPNLPDQYILAWKRKKWQMLMLEFGLRTLIISCRFPLSLPLH